MSCGNWTTISIVSIFTVKNSNMKWYLLEYTIGHEWKHKKVQACDSEDAKSKLPKRARNVRVWLTK